MKLILTSKGLCNRKIEIAFIELLNKRINSVSVCIIPTAAKELKAEHPRIIEAKAIFTKLGVKKVDLLDIEVDRVEKLITYDVIYIGGGDPVHLLDVLRRTGADSIFTKLVEKEITIIGVSAGSLVLGPHLNIVEYFTPYLVTDKKFDLKSLGLFDFPIMPHADREDIFRCDEPIENELSRYEIKYGESVIRIKDENALMIDNKKIRMI